MKILLIVAAVTAIAFAGPTRGSYKPIYTGPTVVDGFEPIHVGPAIVDGFEPIHVGPAVVDFPIPESTVAATPDPSNKSPLIQIVVNVNQQSESSPGAIAIDRPTPVQVSEEEEIVPTPVIVVEEAIPEPGPVIVVDKPEINPEAVIVAPGIAVPAVVGPDTLN